MRKALSGILLGILSLMFIVTTAGSSNAAMDDGDVNNVSIGLIGYNARGADTSSNRNKEFVDLNVSANTNVNDLVITDRWGHSKGHIGSAGQCNSYKITDVGSLDHTVTLRVYVGEGSNAMSSDGKYVYRYMNSPESCGWHGHFIDNLGDRIWISKDGDSESSVFNFENGYTVN
jgi:hypothetical protein